MSAFYTGRSSVLALSVSLALAGCFGGGSGDDSKAPPVEEAVPNVSAELEQAMKDKNYPTMGAALLGEAGALQDQVDPDGFASVSQRGIDRKRAVDEQLLKQVQSVLGAGSGLTDLDRQFLEMMEWDLKVNLEGYKLPLNVVPIHHFRNYAVSWAGEVGAKMPVDRIARTASLDSADVSAAKVAGFDYFGGSTADTLKVEGGGDLASHAASHRDQPMLMRVMSNSASPLEWYKDHLKWINGYNQYLSDVKAGFESGKSRNMVLPKRLVDRMLKQFDASIVDGKLKDFDASLRDVSAAGADATFLRDYQRAVKTASDRFVGLRKYLANNYVGRADGGVGGDGYAGMDDPATKDVHEGKEMYKWYLKKNTTATMSPEEVHQDGLEMVKRIYGEMKKVCTTVGQCKTADPTDAEMKEFLQGYLNKPKFRFDDLNKAELWSETKNPDKIKIAAFNQYGQNPAFSTDTWLKVQAEIDAKTELNAVEKAALKKHYEALYEYYKFKPHMAAEIDNYFLPESKAEADYGIRPVTWADSPYDGVAYYTGNNFYLNTYSPYMINSWSLSTLLAHEAAPGHHFQVALADQLAKEDKLPEYAKRAHYTAYVEGWALYTEALAQEMGMYSGKGLYSKADIESSDPKVEGSPAFKNQLEYFGRLNEEQMRAMRRVVDTGLHWKGWTHDEAVDYMKANSALGDGDISSEVPRYMAYVGQATSYKAGQVSIEQSRQKAKDALGSGFDIKKFHREVLNSGALPLSVLEAKIANWVKAGGK